MCKLAGVSITRLQGLCLLDQLQLHFVENFLLFSLCRLIHYSEHSEHCSIPAISLVSSAKTDQNLTEVIFEQLMNTLFVFHIYHFVL